MIDILLSNLKSVVEDIESKLANIDGWYIIDNKDDDYLNLITIRSDKDFVIEDINILNLKYGENILYKTIDNYFGIRIECNIYPHNLKEGYYLYVYIEYFPFGYEEDTTENKMLQSYYIMRDLSGKLRDRINNYVKIKK